MIVLFFGDVVGAEATDYLARRLPDLRNSKNADLVIVNAENCAPDGLGMAAVQVDRLFEAGADVITGGNHSWDSPESIERLKDSRVLRPHNFAEGVPGQGQAWLEVAGEPVTVLNLIDWCSVKGVKAVADKFMPVYWGWQSAEKRGTVIVDYHGDHVLDKQIFARAVDGHASAVFGTHTHEPTTPLHILPGGTAFVTDVGMTGPMGGVQGFGYEGFVTGLVRTGNPFSEPLPSPVSGPIAIGGVLVEIEGGKATRLERLPSEVEL